MFPGRQGAHPGARQLHPWASALRKRGRGRSVHGRLRGANGSAPSHTCGGLWPQPAGRSQAAVGCKGEELLWPPSRVPDSSSAHPGSSWVRAPWVQAEVRVLAQVYLLA